MKILMRRRSPKAVPWPRCLGRVFMCDQGIGTPHTPKPKPKPKPKPEPEPAKAYEKLHVDDDDDGGGSAGRSRGHRRVGVGITGTATVTFSRLCRAVLGPTRRLVGLRSRAAKSGGGGARRNSAPQQRSLIVEVEPPAEEEALAAACKQFGQQLTEMVTEEDGDLNALMDVEQLVDCYRNLKCPSYRHILGSFYAGICIELFPPSQTSTSSSSSSQDQTSSVF